MLKRRSWIMHKGKPILLNDYTGVSETDFVPTIKTLTANILAERSHEVLLLIDITGCAVSKDVLLSFKHAAVSVKPHVSKIAVVGVSGVQHFFLRIVNTYADMAVEPFSTRDAALNYLAQ